MVSSTKAARLLIALLGLSALLCACGPGVVKEQPTVVTEQKAVPGKKKGGMQVADKYD